MICYRNRPISEDIAGTAPTTGVTLSMRWCIPNRSEPILHFHLNKKQIINTAMNKLIKSLSRIFCALAITATSQASLAEQPNVRDPKTQAIDWVWSGQRVWFDFVSQGKYQMIAYYDESRQMSVAVRELGDVNGSPWIYHKVPSFLGWDAHNKVEVAFDKNGIIHLSGNLHADPLVYFRSTEPYNPRTLEAVKVMAVADDEQQTTYPEFFVGNNDELYFKYRSGTSGQGKWFYNHWNTETGEWSHLHETTLLDGEGKRGAYPRGPVFGPDGYAHMVYVWRENPRASSNHDLSYARSKDLIHWETSTGEKISLPITLDRGEIIDPIPMHGGLLNGGTPIGFDKNNRVLVSYQKYDTDGNTQVFLSRNEKKGWKSVKVSNFKDSRVDLNKSGALDLPLVISEPARINRDGNIVVSAAWDETTWEWVLDQKTLKVINARTVEKSLPEQISKYDEDNGIPLRVVAMSKDQKQKSEEFFISWEAMQPFRDQARPDIPKASTLRMHRIDQGREE